jgi:hypothetical protein
MEGIMPLTIANGSAFTPYRPRRPLSSARGGPGNATLKALRAYALAGTTRYITERLAAQIEGASLTYVSALSCMTAAERDAVRAGTLSLAGYVAKRWRQQSPIDVDDLVAELGADRVLAVLDRLTAPKDSAVA